MAVDTLALFGRRVRACRDAKGMTQEALAKVLGRSRSHVAEIEAGRLNPPITLVEELAAAFDMSAVELLTAEPAAVVTCTMPPLGFDAAALYQRLDDQRMSRGLVWRDVAFGAHVSPSTLTRLGRGDACDVAGLARLLTWLGDTDLAPYITGNTTRTEGTQA